MPPRATGPTLQRLAENIFANRKLIPGLLTNVHVHDVGQCAAAAIQLERQLASAYDDGEDGMHHDEYISTFAGKYSTAGQEIM